MLSQSKVTRLRLSGDGFESAGAGDHEGVGCSMRGISTKRLFCVLRSRKLMLLPGVDSRGTHKRPGKERTRVLK